MGGWFAWNLARSPLYRLEGVWVRLHEHFPLTIVASISQQLRPFLPNTLCLATGQGESSPLAKGALETRSDHRVSFFELALAWFKNTGVQGGNPVIRGVPYTKTRQPCSSQVDGGSLTARSQGLAWKQLPRRASDCGSGW